MGHVPPRLAPPPAEAERRKRHKDLGAGAGTGGIQLQTLLVMEWSTNLRSKRQWSCELRRATISRSKGYVAHGEPGIRLLAFRIIARKPSVAAG